MKLNWTIKRFQDLSTDEFHDLLDLRIRVFVVEQNCPYPELDGKDRQSTHIFGREESGDMVAYARVVDPGLSYPEPSIGRVLTHNSYRGKGLGNDLMEQSMHHIREKYGQVSVRISAQEYLRKYYQHHGFQSSSDIYLEDNIPHLEMTYLPGNESQVEEDADKTRRLFFARKWEEFESAKNDTIDYLESWSAKHLKFRPEDSGWNALQVIDHIITSEKGTIGYMMKKTQADASELPYITKDDRDRSFKLNRRLSSDERYEAPSSLPAPDEAKDMMILLREWDEIRDRYRHFLGTLSTEYYGKLVFRHPYTGPMSVEETLRFLIEHINHHTHQLRRLKEEIAFSEKEN